MYELETTQALLWFSSKSIIRKSTAFCTGNNENHLIKLMCRFHKKSAYNKKYSFYLFYAYNRHLTPLIPFTFLTPIPRGRHV